jgi:hypothetical protein
MPKGIYPRKPRPKIVRTEKYCRFGDHFSPIAEFSPGNSYCRLHMKEYVTAWRQRERLREAIRKQRAA